MISTLKSITIEKLGIRVYKGKSYNSSSLTVSDDETSINYITRTEKNNGVKCRVADEDFDGVEDGNAIIIGDTTATVFYQKERFIVGEHIVILRADWFDENICQFITLQLRRESFRYPAFGRAFTKDLVLETSILMPFLENGDIDVGAITKYMEDFNINSSNVVSDVPDYFLNEGYTKACWYLDNINQTDFESKYAGIKNKSSITLKDRNWLDFALTDFFDVSQSKGDIKLSEIVDGDIPLVSASKVNNGIVAYILEGDGIAEQFKGNCLTADMFGHVFYQPKNFYSVSHGRVNMLTPKVSMNKYVLIFISELLNFQFGIRNSYSRMLTLEMLDKCIIRLPVNNEGEPDWCFMEEYIQSRPFSCNI